MSLNPSGASSRQAPAPAGLPADPPVARRLAAHELARHCDPATLEPLPAPDGSAQADDMAAIVGQERARAAVEFGVAMPHAGYHLYIMGPPGSGNPIASCTRRCRARTSSGLRQSGGIISVSGE